MANSEVGNIDVRVLPGADFQATIGTALSSFARPVENDDVAAFVGALRSARQRDFRPVVTGSTLDPNDAARDLGVRLFEAVFQDETRDALVMAWGSAAASQKAVRLRLQLDHVPELASLPWELMFRADDHLVFGPQPYIARHAGSTDPLPPRAIAGPLRVLVVASLPNDLNALSAAEEYESVASALGGLVDAGTVELGRLEQPTFQQLSARLEEGWHVIHYVGHGDHDPATGGFLALCDEAEQSAPLDARAIGRLLSPPNDVRLVVLNACKSAGGPSEVPLGGVANELMLHGVPAVVAMQFPISDVQALSFAGAFYRSLARNDVIDAAVDRGRRAMITTPEWVTPVLYLRDSGDLFDLSAIASQTEESSPGSGAEVEPAARVPSDLLLDGDVVLARPWLVRAVRSWLDSESHVFALQGKLGIGKSVLCGWLAGGVDDADDADDHHDDDHHDEPPVEVGDAQWRVELAEIREAVRAVHFFSASMIGASTDPRTFVADISRQLAAGVPGFVVATSSANGTLGDLTSEALGLDDLFERAVLRPFLAARPVDPILIVVDGIDEAATDARMTIETWMMELARLDLPVKMILTASDPEYLQFLATLRTPAMILDLDGDDHRAAIDHDVELYTRGRLDRASVVGDEAARIAVARRVAAAADGSFLYAGAVANHLAADGSIDHDDELVLPDALGQLYELRLEALLAAEFDDASGGSWEEGWARDVEPVAGLLAVAVAPVPEPALGLWLGLTLPRLLGLTSRFRQLIRWEGRRLVLAHPMFAQFLLGADSAMAVHRFRIDEVAAHRSIVDSTLDVVARGDLDRAHELGGEYSLVHLVAHARALLEHGAQPELLDRLIDSVTSPEYLAALERCCIDPVDIGRPARELADLLIDRKRLDDVERVVTCLARASSTAVRQGVFDVLVQLGAADERAAGSLITSLALGDDPSMAEVALRATIVLSASSQAAVFRDVVRQGSEPLRCVAAYALYSNAGENSPTLIGEVLDRLVADLTLRKPWTLREPLEFFAQVTVTNYINHCDDPDVAAMTSDLFRRLLVDRFHLDVLNVKPVAFAASMIMARQLSTRVMAAVGGDDDGAIGEAVPGASAARLVIPALDPAVDLGAIESEVATMLDSDVPLLRMLGATVLVVHHADSPEAGGPIVERAFDRGDQRRRAWILMGHAVVSQTTPNTWVEPLERMTATIGREGATATGADELGSVDLLFASLALAYAKVGGEMQVHRQLLASDDGDVPAATKARCVWGIGVAGLHFPDQAFHELDRLVADGLVDRDAIVAPLALMAGLHPLRVRAWARQQFDDDQADRVGQATVVATTRSHLELLGHLNNGLNLALRHPKMRRRIGMTVFSLFLESSSRREWTRKYALAGMELLRDSGYELIRWTLPDDEE